TLAFLQALIFLLLSPLLGVHLRLVPALFILLVLFLVSFGLAGLGLLFAWRMDSTQGFHAIMNLFLMPMWFLSGALFPVDGAPRWLAATMLVDPLTYSVFAIRYGLFFPDLFSLRSFPSPLFCL